MNAWMKVYKRHENFVPEFIVTVLKNCIEIWESKFIDVIFFEF